MIIGLHDEPEAVTASRHARQALARVQAKMAASQMGEAFAGLDDRRHVASIARGVDRREGV